MTTNELKKEYFELLKEELARKEAIKADLSEKIKDKENRYFSTEFDSVCRQVISLKHDIMNVQDELENTYSLDVEEFETIENFRKWKDLNPNTKIKNIYPAKKMLGYEDRHIKQMCNVAEMGLEKIVNGTALWGETSLYVVYWKKISGEIK